MCRSLPIERTTTSPELSPTRIFTCLRSPTMAEREVRIFSTRCAGVYARGAAAGAAAVSRVPQLFQNCAPSGFSC
jgi:hypothetical protein